MEGSPKIRARNIRAWPYFGLRRESRSVECDLPAAVAPCRGGRRRRPVRPLRSVGAALAFPALLFAGAPALSQDADAGRPAYWGSPSVDGGKCCQTLGEVRAHIDQLDGEILAAMAERGKYVAEAGRFKKDPAAVSAPARVEAIIARVRKIAAEDGLSPEVAERSYRAMIAAFEDYERAEWLKRRPAAP